MCSKSPEQCVQCFLGKQNKSKAQSANMMKLVVEFEKKEERVMQIVTELEDQLKERAAKVCGYRV